MGRKKRKPASTRPRVSLCMIVRDETTMLPDCLASVRGAVDEVVVVDTGSVDDTPQVARAAGAIVVHRPWDDDFAAPRNLAITVATGDWILVLDADERLTRGAAKIIRRAVERVDIDCGLLPLHNAADAEADIEAVRRGRGRASEVSFLPRLLRRTDDLAFEGVIHENVSQWLHRRSSRIRLLDGADIVHLGYASTVQAARQKYLRDVTLLEKAIAEDPDDPSYYGYLALGHLDAGEVGRARQTSEEGWVRLPPPARGTEVFALRLAVARAAAALDAGDYGVAFETLAVGQEHWPDHPDLWFLHGCAAEALVLDADTAIDRRQWIDEATSAFERAQAQRDGFFVQRFLTGASTWAASLRLGYLALLRGRPRDAQRIFETAAHEGATAALCDLGRAEAHLDRCQVERAAKLIERHLRDEDGHADAWLLAALAAEQSGDIGTMSRLLVETRRRLKGGFAAVHRRERFFDAVAVASLHHGEPMDAPGPFGQLAVLLRGASHAVKGGAAREPCPGMLERLLQALVRRGEAEALEGLLDPSVEAYLPGIGTALSEAVERMPPPARATG